jgi:D-sedoheptulose 7-phosphate isomerase
VFVGITTSGTSKNVVAAFHACGELGVTSVALCGLGGDLEPLVDHLLRVPSRVTARIQESHITIGHMVCAQVERAIFDSLRPR